MSTGPLDGPDAGARAAVHSQRASELLVFRAEDGQLVARGVSDRECAQASAHALAAIALVLAQGNVFVKTLTQP